MFLLTPVVAVFGMLALVGVIGLSFLLPLLAITLAIGGHYVWAIASVITWLLWLRFGGRVRRYVYEGFEHGSI